MYRSCQCRIHLSKSMTHQHSCTVNESPVVKTKGMCNLRSAETKTHTYIHIYIYPFAQSSALNHHQNCSMNIKQILAFKGGFLHDPRAHFLGPDHIGVDAEVPPMQNQPSCERCAVFSFGLTQEYHRQTVELGTGGTCSFTLRSWTSAHRCSGRFPWSQMQ